MNINQGQNEGLLPYTFLLYASFKMTFRSVLPDVFLLTIYPLILAQQLLCHVVLIVLRYDFLEAKN